MCEHPKSRPPRKSVHKDVSVQIALAFAGVFLLCWAFFSLEDTFRVLAPGIAHANDEGDTPALQENVEYPEYTWQETTLTSLDIITLETTPFGIFAGENTFSALPSMYNGVYKSKDFGQTWQAIGLAGAGINDLAWEGNKLYAATQFVKDGKLGLYVSEDQGESWTRTSMSLSGQSVYAAGGRIYYGGTNHGLWISENGEGDEEEWTQKIGTGYYGPKIYKISGNEEVLLAAGETETYISRDRGDTWQNVGALNTHRIRDFAISDSLLLAATHNGNGIFSSRDSGNTWTKMSFWEGKTVGAVEMFLGKIYVSAEDTTFPTSGNELKPKTVFVSDDGGKTWQNTGLNLPNTTSNVRDITGIFNQASSLLIAPFYDTLRITTVSPSKPAKNQFLGTLFAGLDLEDMLQHISSYFDHQYPLSGYSYYKESAIAGGKYKDSVVDFLGREGKPPEIYYSSHGGFDFALPYGTEIISPAPGWASYYYCTACGHTIKIDHDNGYETTYLHMQKDGLITDRDPPVRISTGNVVGKIGMTGNTTGPHLHFTVKKDQNGNGAFDDFPSGLTDPFGWWHKFRADPWENLIWVDTLGSHTGTRSDYLWTGQLPEIISTVNSANTHVIFGNITVSPDEAIAANALTFVLNIGPRPMLQAQTHLKYIKGTSISVQALNLVGKEISLLPGILTITMNFGQDELSPNIQQDTLQIHFFDLVTREWKPLPTLSLDLDAKVITAETTHLSNFALLGNRRDFTPPETQILVEGEKGGINDDWYLEYPMISFSTHDAGHDTEVGTEEDVQGTQESTPEDTVTTYYRLTNEIDWREYVEPFNLDQLGILGIEYKSVDRFGNWEETKFEQLKIALNRRVGEVRIKQTEFIVL